MSMSINQMAVATTPCPRCGAAPRKGCRSRSGKRASYPHVDRQQAVWEGWQTGYSAGLEDALQQVRVYLAQGWTMAQYEAWLANYRRRRP